MKKMYLTMTALLLAMMSMTVVSCDWDDDDEIAYTLEGTWQGKMYLSSEWNNQVYDITYSEICFLRDGYSYSSGTGYWVDYYSNTGWGRNYVANHIDWTVNGRTITVYFREEGTTLWIEDYRLSDNYFTGTIYDGESRVDFRLTHTASPNWNDYYWGYDGWGYGYYSKESPMTRATDADAATGNGNMLNEGMQMPRRFVSASK